MAHNRVLFWSMISAIQPFHGHPNENVNTFLQNVNDVCQTQNVKDENRITLLRLM